MGGMGERKEDANRQFGLQMTNGEFEGREGGKGEERTRGGLEDGQTWILWSVFFHVHLLLVFLQPAKKKKEKKRIVPCPGPGKASDQWQSVPNTRVYSGSSGK